MPARQEGVFTKRLSDKQYIMKATSLLEHKGVFLVFVFTGHNNNLSRIIRTIRNTRDKK
jgi:hypothetical protein